MNQIVSLNSSSALTMSNREIAELTGKLHTHVTRDIRAMLSGLGVNETKFGSAYIDAKGEERGCFSLPKREPLILVSGYKVGLRARIVDRWMELEQQTQVVPLTSRPRSSRRSALPLMRWRRG